MPYSNLQIINIGSYAYASLPNASSVYPGTQAYVTNIGTAGSYWVSNGTSWYPLNGSYVAASKTSTIAAPIVTFSGAASGKFTLPAGDPVLIANSLLAGAFITVEAHVHKRSATATGVFDIRFGTAGAVGDSLIGTSNTISSSNLTDLKARQQILIVGSGSICGTGYGSTNNVSVTTYTDKTTNINTAAVMYVSFYMSSANAADSFDLIGYKVTVEY